jgi:hypothetical protein
MRTLEGKVVGEGVGDVCQSGEDIHSGSPSKLVLRGCGGGADVGIGGGDAEDTGFTSPAAAVASLVAPGENIT